jgi:DNA polymerase III epsilon subunit-like protein
MTPPNTMGLCRPTILSSLTCTASTRTTLVGHGVRSVWRLLSKALPGLEPAGFADTLKLAERVHGKGGNTLAERVAAAGLGAATDALAPGRAAHNALWDALAAALLLKHFAGTLGLTTPGAIVHAAAVKNKAVPVAAPTLFD